jgi:hypothetical protein
MNERIKELAEQAGIKIIPRRPFWDDERHGYLESDNDFIQNNEEIVIKLLEGDALKNLAELIVGECADVLLQWKNEPFPFDEDVAVSLIKEHFGVEE